MRGRGAGLGALALAACAAPPAPPEAPAQPIRLTDGAWVLTEVNEASAEAAAELRFGADNRFTGQGPCNRIDGGYQRGDDGAFQVGALLTRQNPCPDQPTEYRLIDGLLNAEKMEIGPEGLVIRSGAGPTLRFEHRPLRE